MAAQIKRLCSCSQRSFLLQSGHFNHLSCNQAWRAQPCRGGPALQGLHSPLFYGKRKVMLWVRNKLWHPFKEVSIKRNESGRRESKNETLAQESQAFPGTTQRVYILWATEWVTTSLPAAGQKQPQAIMWPCSSAVLFMSSEICTFGWHSKFFFWFVYTVL